VAEPPPDTVSHPTPPADEQLVAESVEHGLLGAGAEIRAAAITSGPEPPKRRGLGFGAWVAIGWLGFIVLTAILAKTKILTWGDPFGNSRVDTLRCAERGPLSDQGGAPGFLLGCDSNGRSMAARLALGSWTSLLVSTGAIVIGFTIGGTIGLVAGYFGGKIDTVISSAFNVLLSIPAIVLAIALVAVLKGDQSNPGGLPIELILIIAIGVVAIPLVGRISRASALSWSQREFVLAAKAQGAKHGRIMIRELLPNVAPAMFSISLLGIAVAIVAEGTLAVLGISVQPPTPSWGQIIADDRSRIATSPHILLEPALLIFFTVFALNFLGDVVRARFDVREGAL
jgi:peptide/nickel transport system permease protein